MTISFEEVGVQFVLGLNPKNTVPELVVEAAYAREMGFQQVWINDALGTRNQIAVLSAIGATSPMKLGTAITCPYFRHPMDMADALASISELIAPHELSVGMARGPFSSRNPTKAFKPISMLREAAQFLKRVLAGERVKYGDFPALVSYFNLNPQESARMQFTPKAPVLLYCGGQGIKSMAVGGEYMDGILFGGHFLALHRVGRVRMLLEIAEAAAKRADPNKKLRKVAEIHISVSSDARAARNYPKQHITRELPVIEEMGLTEEDFSKLGIPAEDLMRLKQALAKGMSSPEAAALVTDAMVDATFIAGDIESCKPRILEACQAAADYGFERVSFAKVGPNHKEGMRLLADLLPSVTSRRSRGM
jgi:alkanesulfonate monooxygenase SsuD/methylene tetrahydromethanopterin reductase-like flavin-dependent oxidoreductase (luciferase family)